MNKKNLWGVLIVLLISSLVLYFDLRATPVATLKAAAGQIIPWRLVLVFLAMALSYVCEALILRLLAKAGDSQAELLVLSADSAHPGPFQRDHPMATGGQPSQLAAMVEMGMAGGRATSILMMKFICYQLVVLFAYLTAFIFGFHFVAGKFSALAIFIFLGFASTSSPSSCSC